MDCWLGGLKSGLLFFSNCLSKLTVLVCLVAQLCLTLCDPWTAAHRAPLSVGFLRQEYWSGLPFASPWDLPDLGFKPGSPALQADFSASEPLGNSMYESSQYSSCCRFSKVCIFLSFHAFYVIMLPEMWIYLGWRKSERKAPISLSLSS